MKPAAFRIGSIPVRIHGSFLLMTVFLGFGRAMSLPLLLEWFLVVLVAVLLHEMGHALMGKAFGLAPEIDLHGMGGTTSWSTGRNIGNGPGILISLAGPLTGIAVAGLVVVAVLFSDRLPSDGLGAQAISDFVWVNGGWGVANLVPMLPLDGGNVMRSALNAATKGRGEMPARIVSMAVSGLLLATIAITTVILRLSHDPAGEPWIVRAFGDNWWVGILALLFTVQNYRAFQALGAARTDAPLKQALDDAYDALKQRDARRVLALSLPVIDAARSLPIRAEAIHLAAYALLLDGRPAEADQMIARLPQGYPPHAAYADLKAQLAAQP